MMTTASSYKYHKYIDIYMEDVRTGRVKASKRLVKAMDFIELKIDREDVFIDTKRISEAKRVIEEYFEIELLNWQLFIIALIHCYYKEVDQVVFSEFLILMGRGNGKNGFISPLIWYLTTGIHGIKGYNVEIIANSEQQAKTSFVDVYEMLDDNWNKMKRGFHKTKEQITSRATKSYIKYNTSNARTKDGKRSACLVFDEIHEYENYDSINVFKSGFGKRRHSRVFYITTNGYVRDGVLDNELQKADDILNGVITELGYLPLIYELDDEEEAENEELWEKANPSINYFPNLKIETQKHWIDAKYQPSTYTEFFTKRMNLPKGNTDIEVTSWENILATNQEIPDLEGKTCVVGIDYAKTTDFVAAGLLFREGGKYYWLSHTWVCSQSNDLSRIKAPLEEWEKQGLLTFIEGPEVHPDIPAEWLAQQAKHYNLTVLGMDNYRYTLLSRSLREVGFDIDRKGVNNIRLIRPSNQMQIAPTITSLFVNKNIVWGDSPLMRWYANNTSMVTSQAGNVTYGKIEEKSRKTDGFMAFVAAMCVSDELPEESEGFFLDVYTY